MLKVFGRNGAIQNVTQGKGLGIRQHDDVMLSYGYSRYTWQKMEIPVGQTAVIKITVPSNIQHHAEGRILSTRDSSIEFKVLVGAVDGEFPAVVNAMPIRNSIEEQAFTPLTLFDFCGYVAHGAEPSTGVVYAEPELYGAPALGPRNAIEGFSQSIKGRYSSAGTKAILIKNLGTTDPAIVYYQYDWHEFVQ